MTLDDALKLGVGDYVTHKHTAVTMRPIRITELWVNEKRTIVLVRLASVASSAWLDATGYENPPAGKKWCKTCSAWETKALHEEIHGPALAGRR